MPRIGLFLCALSVMTMSGCGNHGKPSTAETEGTPAIIDRSDNPKEAETVEQKSKGVGYIEID